MQEIQIHQTFPHQSLEISLFANIFPHRIYIIVLYVIPYMANIQVGNFHGRLVVPFNDECLLVVNYSL